MNQFWTKDKVRDMILGLYKTTGKINSQYARTQNRNFHAAAVRLYGSWKKAVEAAGLDYSNIRMRHSWTKEQVQNMIRQLHKTTGRINYQCVDNKLRSAAVYLYGSWKKAVEVAGFDYSSVKIHGPKPYWTEEKIVAQIAVLFHQNTKINSSSIQICHGGLYNAGKRRFGSWKKAVEAAGFNYPCIVGSRMRGHKPHWTRERIIAQIVKFCHQNGRINSFYMKNHHAGVYSSGIRRFGSWKKAIEAAGFPYSSVIERRPAHSPRIWSKAKVIEEIRRLHCMGTPLYGYFLLKNGHDALPQAGRRLFGSWGKAINAAGLDYGEIKPFRSWTRQAVIKEIRRLARAGVRLSHKAMAKTRSDLVGAAHRRIGSWDQAVEAAGINYKEHCINWSTTAWLRKLRNEDVRTLKHKAKTLSQKRRRR